jgi:glycosyltransferase involved in cell wall biosynthesis
MKVIIIINAAWNLVNFRSGLIRALVTEGHEVVAVAPYDSYAPQLDAFGCRYVPLRMANQGVNPVQDAWLIWRFLKLFHDEKPDVFLGYTVKPNVYGSFVANLVGVPVVNNITGLGAVFIRESWVTRLVCTLYRHALSHSHKVFFQNSDDQRLFIEKGMVKPDISDLLPGSGVDLQRFSYVPLVSGKDRKKRFRFLLIARMLRDKGVGEYVAAAKIIRDRFPYVECCLLGFVDVENPEAISGSEIDVWVAQGAVRYLGVRDDVRGEIIEADCVVLPSYREGTPRSLLEAAAVGRPLIATDVPGCREVVENGKNGFLCKVKDAQSLAENMSSMLLLSDDERHHMGLYGRKKMERQYNEWFVIKRYIKVLDQIAHTMTN